jgi:hypothetical protein
MARFAKQNTICDAAHAALVGFELMGLTLLALAVLALSLPATTDSAFADDKNQAPAASQPAATPPPAPPPAPAAAAPLVPAQPPAAYKPGFLHELKVWWDNSLAVFDGNRGKTVDPNKKPDQPASGAQPAAADAAKDAPKEATKDTPKSPVTATQDAMKNAVDVTKGAATTAATAATDAMKNAVDATKDAAAALARLPNTRVVDVHETCARAPNGAHDCAAAAATGCRGKGFNDGKPLDVRTAQKCEPKPLQPGEMPGMQCGTEAVVIRAVCQ